MAASRCAMYVCGAALLATAACSDTQTPASGPQIPLNLMLKLSSLENFTEFRDFIDEQSLEEDTDLEIGNRFGDDVNERKAVMKPDNAVCRPEMQVVELVEQKNSSLLYFPTCTRVERCGGCCVSELLRCQPTDTEIINYWVYVSSYSNSGKFKVIEKKIVSVQRHLACKCSCAVKKEDCSMLQEYEEDNCRCRCTNTDKETKCRAENNTKIWDPNTCICSCRQTLMCSSGYYFDHNTCMCAMAINRRRHVADAESRHRYKYTTKLSPVLPLDQNDSFYPLEEN